MRKLYTRESLIDTTFWMAKCSIYWDKGCQRYWEVWVKGSHYHGDMSNMPSILGLYHMKEVVSVSHTHMNLRMSSIKRKKSKYTSLSSCVIFLSGGWGATKLIHKGEKAQLIKQIRHHPLANRLFFPYAPHCFNNKINHHDS